MRPGVDGQLPALRRLEPDAHNPIDPQLASLDRQGHVRLDRPKTLEQPTRASQELDSDPSPRAGPDHTPRRSPRPDGLGHRRSREAPRCRFEWPPARRSASTNSFLRREAAPEKEGLGQVFATGGDLELLNLLARRCRDRKRPQEHVAVSSPMVCASSAIRASRSAPRGCPSRGSRRGAPSTRLGRALRATSVGSVSRWGCPRGDRPPARRWLCGPPELRPGRTGVPPGRARCHSEGSGRSSRLLRRCTRSACTPGSGGTAWGPFVGSGLLLLPGPSRRPSARRRPLSLIATVRPASGVSVSLG